MKLKPGVVITVDEQHCFSMVYFEIQDQFLKHRHQRTFFAVGWQLYWNPREITQQHKNVKY